MTVENEFEMLKGPEWTVSEGLSTDQAVAVAEETAARHAGLTPPAFDLIAALNRPNAKTLVVLAHPDDEFVGFGPVFARLNPATTYVILLTDPSIYRYAKFAESMERLEVARWWCYGANDTPGYNPAEDQALLQTLVRQISEYTPDLIFTHSPTSGDYGNHPHHSGLGLQVGLAVAANRPGLRARGCEPQLFYLHTEGYAERPLLLTSPYHRYVEQLKIMSETYHAEVPHLEREKYPLKSSQLYVTIPDEEIAKSAVDQVYDHKISNHALTMLPDPWNTAGQYESYKRERIMSTYAEWVRGLSRPTFVVDMGIGHGRNWSWLADNHTTAYPSGLLGFDTTPAYLADLQKLPNYLGTVMGVHEHYGMERKLLHDLKQQNCNDSTATVLSFQQSIYYFNYEQLTSLLSTVQPDYLYVENIPDDYFEIIERACAARSVFHKIVFERRHFILGLKTNRPTGEYTEVPVQFTNIPVTVFALTYERN